MKVVLWLFVLNLGIALGAGLYESRITVPEWTSSPAGEPAWNPEAAGRHDTGRRFWVFVTTVPLTLLTLASLVLAWRSEGPLRTWWLAAALIALAERVFTFSYFIPTMVRLVGTPDSLDAQARAIRWANLSYLRHALVLAALLSALSAFARYYEQRGGGP